MFLAPVIRRGSLNICQSLHLPPGDTLVFVYPVPDRYLLRGAEAEVAVDDPVDAEKVLEDVGRGDSHGAVVGSEGGAPAVPPLKGEGYVCVGVNVYWPRPRLN